MSSPDVTFPDRIRFAAEILREIVKYQNHYAGAYTATDLEDIAAEIEANQRHQDHQITELAGDLMAFGGDANVDWVSDGCKATTLARQLVVARGWRKGGNE